VSLERVWKASDLGQQRIRNKGRITYIQCLKINQLTIDPDMRGLQMGHYLKRHRHIASGRQSEEGYHALPTKFKAYLVAHVQKLNGRIQASLGVSLIFVR
jgi:hypothetical protein